MPSKVSLSPIEYRSTESLIGYVNNVKLHPDGQIDQIASSIAEYNFLDPIAVDEQGVILEGHGRLAAARKMGLTEVPVIQVIGLTEAQKKGYRLAHNKLTMNSGFDEEALKAELEALEELEYDLKLTGFDESELDEILQRSGGEGYGAGGGSGDEDEIPPEDEIEQRVSRGQVWAFADHLVMCGDCRDASDVQKLLGNEPINICMTSPPYASQRKYDEESGFKPIPPDGYVHWFAAVQDNVKRHLAKDGSFFLNIKEHCEDGQRSLYVKDLTIAHVRRWGWRFVDEFCWLHEDLPGAWKNRFRNGFEPVFHFCKQIDIKFYPKSVGHFSTSIRNGSGGLQKTIGGNYTLDAPLVEGIAQPSNTIKASGDGNKNHAAAYPVALPEFFIKAFSDERDRIFDPFGGSGTTAVAAHRNNRKALLMEISEKYCDLILTRLERETGDTARLIDSVQTVIA